MKYLRKIKALFNRLLALAKNIKRTPGRLNKLFGKIGQSLATIRAGARRWGRNQDADRARLYAARIQADLARQGLKSEYTFRRFKKTVKRQRLVEFVPPLVVTSTGVMMRVNTGGLPSGVQIADIENPKVVQTLAHAVNQEVYVTAKDPRAGTLIQIAEISAVDGIPRLVWSNEVSVQEDTPLSFVVGKGKNGNVVADLESMPHYLVAGATQQGKSVHMWHVVTTIARRNHPADVRLALFDLKRGTMFHPLRTLPHLLFPIIDDTDKVLNALQALVDEMDERYTAIRERGQSTVIEYNKLPNVEKFPLLVVALDELAEITRGEDRAIRLEGTYKLAKLLRLSAGAGMHFIVSTQHPNADVLKGEIRANIPEAIAFRTAKRTQSEVIIERGGAENIRVKGRALFKLGAELLEVQTPLIKEGGGVHGIYGVVSEIVTKWQTEAETSAEGQAQAAIEAASQDTQLKEDMLRYARVQLAGKFAVKEIYREFQGRATQKRVKEIAIELETAGVLSAATGRASRLVIGSLRVAEASVAPVGVPGALRVDPQAGNSQLANQEPDEPVAVWLLKPGDPPENALGPYTRAQALGTALYGPPGTKLVGAAELDVLKAGTTLWGDNVEAECPSP